MIKVFFSRALPSGIVKQMGTGVEIRPFAKVHIVHLLINILVLHKIITIHGCV